MVHATPLLSHLVVNDWADDEDGGPGGLVVSLPDLLAALVRPWLLRRFILIGEASTGDLSSLAVCKGLLEVSLSCMTNSKDLGPLVSLRETLVDVTLDDCPIADLSPIAHMRLKLLRLCYLPVANLGPLSALAATLESLQIIGCPKVRKLGPLSACTDLRHLSISETQVSDLGPLASCRMMETFTLCEGPKVTSLAPLASCPCLISIAARCTGITSIAPLAACTQLKALNVANTYISDLRPLAGFSRLKSLQCGNTRVSDLRPLAGLSCLWFLDVSNTKVTDVTPLARMSLLRHLDVSDTEVADVGALGHLRELRIIQGP